MRKKRTTYKDICFQCGKYAPGRHVTLGHWCGKCEDKALRSVAHRLRKQMGWKNPGSPNDVVAETINGAIQQGITVTLRTYTKQIRVTEIKNTSNGFKFKTPRGKWYWLTLPQVDQLYNQVINRVRPMGNPGRENWPHPGDFVTVDRSKLARSLAASLPGDVLYKPCYVVTVTGPKTKTKRVEVIALNHKRYWFDDDALTIVGHATKADYERYAYGPQKNPLHLKQRARALIIAFGKSPLYPKTVRGFKMFLHEVAPGWEKYAHLGWKVYRRFKGVRKNPLSEKNFYREQAGRRIDTGNVKMFERFTYESESKIYNVDLIEPALGTKRYAINSRYVDQPTKIHREIEKHFGI